ncbi:hypothetical protein B0H16DRAFT_1718347 [Mycena metata]|uniref:Uncharacterized protein n=1 Tax=Mycena metata TaxID=1033252 RepID=A0AAD7NJG4_9AGAR|nr:hypothetical protein B0H16DRAFT_1718347 [Mycena metata]
MSNFCPPGAVPGHQYMGPGSDGGAKFTHTQDDESGDEAQDDTKSEDDSSVSSIQTANLKQRRSGAWPRLTDQDSALIRFLSGHGIAPSAIAAHKECGWAPATIKSHAAKKNKTAQDEEYIDDTFYRILGELDGKKKGLRATKTFAQKKSGRKYETQGRSAARTHSSAKKQTVPIDAPRGRPQTTSTGRSSALRGERADHDDFDAQLASFVENVGLDTECYAMLKAAGVTVEKLARSKDVPREDLEEFISLHLPAMKPLDRLLFLTAALKVPSS